MATPLKNILCIDDENDILEIAKFALETLGHFHLEICSNSKEALDRAAETKPDMILLDVIMPDKDGLSVYRELRQTPQLANVPVAFMTAKVQPSEVQNYLDMGAEGVISKPFDPLALPDAVQSLWRARQTKTQNKIMVGSSR